jgi:hypothetical protein
MSLLSKLRHRVLELMIVSDLPRAEAVKKAALEYGPLIKTDSAAPTKAPTDASNAREALFAKILAMKARSESVGSPPPTDSPPQNDAPTTAGRLGNAVRKLFEREPDDEPAAPKPVEESAESMAAGCVSRIIHSGRGVDISGEFPLDPLLANWRATQNPPALMRR